VLSALLGENVTRGALKNLITDKPSPLTMSLAQIEKSDSDVLSALLGENITRGALKNLITDKPSPITVALAQKDSSSRQAKIAAVMKAIKAAKPLSDKDVEIILDGFNFTREHLNKIVTDW
jgi:hypothetical protein